MHANRLSYEQLKSVWGVCERYKNVIAENPWTLHVNCISVVLFECNSLEKQIVAKHIMLGASSASCTPTSSSSSALSSPTPLASSDQPPSDREKEVDDIMGTIPKIYDGTDIPVEEQQRVQTVLQEFKTLEGLEAYW